LIYWVPDDVAARFDCESRLSLKGAAGASRVYGNYFGATFYIDGGGGKDYSIALLWARISGYWKIVSWHTDPESDDIPEIPRPPEVKIARVKADASLVEATRTFLETWLIRKNYDEAFRYLSPESYACYNLARNPDEPVAGSTEEAGRRVRASLERGGNSVGSRRTLDEVIEGVQASHSGIRVMDHRASRTYGFSSWPDAFAAAANCAARARRDRVKTDVPLVYGKAFGMNIRIRMRAGEPPVLRTLWMKEAEAWRIVAYDVETP
jgi:hypothetical protein